MSIKFMEIFKNEKILKSQGWLQFLKILKLPQSKPLSEKKLKYMKSVGGEDFSDEAVLSPMISVQLNWKIFVNKLKFFKLKYFQIRKFF